MLPLDVIVAKRDGAKLEERAIAGFVRGVVEGTIPDYQTTALLMAIHFQGLDLDETAALTRAIVDSGRVLDFGDLGPVVDKHSTGGVGDTVSLVAAPLAAAAGVVVPMISGRSLGHTGGTLDKLTAIPGLRVALSPADFRKVVERVGLAIVEAGSELAPGDAALYRLRDASGTVPNHGLITASILGKKLCVAPRGLVMDVKVGNGTFLRLLDDAEALAARMAAVAERFGLAVRFLFSDMDEPLSPAIGNALEVERAIRILRGEEKGGRLLTVALAVAGQMIALAERAGDQADGKRRAEAALGSGEGVTVLARMIEAQGGDARVVDDPARRLPQARAKRTLRADRDGYIGALDARGLGIGAARLGIGRQKLGSPVDAASGIILKVDRGEPVQAGSELCELRAGDGALIDDALPIIEAAIRIADRPPPPRAGSPILGESC